MTDPTVKWKQLPLSVTSKPDTRWESITITQFEECPILSVSQRTCKFYSTITSSVHTADAMFPNPHEIHDMRVVVAHTESRNVLILGVIDQDDMVIPHESDTFSVSSPSGGNGLRVIRIHKSAIPSKLTDRYLYEFTYAKLTPPVQDNDALTSHNPFR